MCLERQNHVASQWTSLSLLSAPLTPFSALLVAIGTWEEGSGSSSPSPGRAAATFRQILSRSWLFSSRGGGATGCGRRLHRWVLESFGRVLTSPFSIYYIIFFFYFICTGIRLFLGVQRVTFPDLGFGCSWIDRFSFYFFERILNVVGFDTVA